MSTSSAKRGPAPLAFSSLLTACVGFIGVGAECALAQTTRINVAADGTQADGSSGGVVMSRDGRWVGYHSGATNLVANDAGANQDAFLYDRLTGVTERVSVGTDGDELDRGSYIDAISDDGRFVVFTSVMTTHLVPPSLSRCVPANSTSCRGIFVRDRTLGTTTIASVSSTGAVGNADSFGASVSADGRFIAFASLASNLVPGDTNAASDIFVHDRRTGETARVSVTSSGEQTHLSSDLSYAGPNSTSPRLSADGRTVVFESAADNLTADPVAWCSSPSFIPTPCGGVFVHDREGHTTELVSVPVAGAGSWQGGSNAQISSDARFVTFEPGEAYSYVRVPFSPPVSHPVVAYLHDRQTRQTLEVYRSSEMMGWVWEGATTAISPDGRYVAVVTVRAGTPLYGYLPPLRLPTLAVLDRQRGTWTQIQKELEGPTIPPVSYVESLAVAGAVPTVAFATSATNLVADDTNGQQDVFVVNAFDPDWDGVSTDWEAAFGFNPFDASDGVEDADHDGVMNADEAAQQTHPKGLASATRYFAEGARSSFFTTEFSIANPTLAAATVLLRYASPHGGVAHSTVAVPARTSRTVTVPDTGFPEFATRVETDVPVVVDRLMTWTPDTGYGSHGEHALAGPSTTWFFAEGATHSGFDLFYLLYNPSDTVANVRVRYLRPSGAPLEKTYDVAAGQRFNIWANLETFDGALLLAASDVSASLEVLNGVPIIAERAMYLTKSMPGAVVFEAGHESAGVTAPAASWIFAEGATGDAFDLFVLLANPGDTAATVRGTYLLPDGTTYTKNYQVPANARVNIWVDLEAFDGVAGTPLAVVNAVSSTFEVVSGPPNVAERSMWWPGPTAATWAEGHNSPGATTTAARWVAAAGKVHDGESATDTFYLLANPAATPASVTVTLLLATSTVSKTFTVAPTSRFTVNARAECPLCVGRGFSALVEASTPITVEWAIYADARGRRWAAGANALATPLP